MKHTLIALAARLLIALALPAYVNANAQPYPGTPSAGGIVDKVIIVGANTRYANVIQNETVRFVARNPDGSETRFEWRFDTYLTRSIALADIAPTSFQGSRSVRIYVARPPSGD